MKHLSFFACAVLLLLQSCDQRTNNYSYIAMPNYKKIKLQNPITDSMKLSHIMGGAEGVMALGLTRQYGSEAGGTNMTYSWAGINFIDMNSRSFEPGTISINGRELYFPSLFSTKGVGIPYPDLFKPFTWHISGGSFGPEASFNIAGGFPEYKNDIVEKADKDGDLMFAFNPSTTSNAERAYILLWAGNTYHVSEVAGTSNSSIAISKDELTRLYNDSPDGLVNVNIVLYRLYSRGHNGKTIHFPLISETNWQMTLD